MFSLIFKKAKDEQNQPNHLYPWYRKGKICEFLWIALNLLPIFMWDDIKIGNNWLKTGKFWTIFELKQVVVWILFLFQIGLALLFSQLAHDFIIL